jgi:hypothetical protein
MLRYALGTRLCRPWGRPGRSREETDRHGYNKRGRKIKTDALGERLGSWKQRSFASESDLRCRASVGVTTNQRSGRYWSLLNCCVHHNIRLKDWESTAYCAFRECFMRKPHFVQWNVSSQECNAFQTINSGKNYSFTFFSHNTDRKEKDASNNSSLSWECVYQATR